MKCYNLIFELYPNYFAFHQEGGGGSKTSATFCRSTLYPNCGVISEVNCALQSLVLKFFLLFIFFSRQVRMRRNSKLLTEKVHGGRGSGNALSCGPARYIRTFEAFSERFPLGFSTFLCEFILKSPLAYSENFSLLSFKWDADLFSVIFTFNSFNIWDSKKSHLPTAVLVSLNHHQSLKSSVSL